MIVHVPTHLLLWAQNGGDDACCAQAARVLEIGPWKTQPVCIAVIVHLYIWWLVTCQYKVRIAKKKSRSGKTSIGRLIIPLSVVMDVSKESSNGDSPQPPEIIHFSLSLPLPSETIAGLNLSFCLFTQLFYTLHFCLMNLITLFLHLVILNSNLVLQNVWHASHHVVWKFKRCTFYCIIQVIRADK